MWHLIIAKAWSNLTIFDIKKGMIKYMIILNVNIWFDIKKFLSRKLFSVVYSILKNSVRLQNIFPVNFRLV